VERPERILFVTGRLAESPLRDVLSTASVAAAAEAAGAEGPGGPDWSFDVAVLGVSVAALLHTDLVARRLDPPQGFDRVVLPGWCQGDLQELGDSLGLPVDRGPKDLYDLPPEEEAQIATVANSLDQALDALDSDRQFLKAGGVMTDDMIDAYIRLKMEEVQRLRQATHPLEFEMYYSA